MENKTTITKSSDGKFRGIIYQYKLLVKDENEGYLYIGKTNHEKTRRQNWNKPNNKNYGGARITEARMKYGVKVGEVWEYSVLEVLCDADLDTLVAQLKEREKHWIRERDSVEHGFNTAFGEGNAGIKYPKGSRKKAERGDFHHTPETIERLKQTSTGRKKSEEEKLKIGQGNRGKKRTMAMRQRQSERMRGVEPVAASEGAKKWREKNGGGYWKGKTMNDEARENMKKAKRKIARPVIAHYPGGDVKCFSSLVDCYNETGVAPGSITSNLRTGGKGRTKSGFWFEEGGVEHV